MYLFYYKESNTTQTYDVLEVIQRNIEIWWLPVELLIHYSVW